VAAAVALIDSLRQSQRVAPILEQMEVLLEAYIKLAEKPVPANCTDMNVPGGENVPPHIPSSSFRT
jgi:hypothetical protein